MLKGFRFQRNCSAASVRSGNECFVLIKTKVIWPNFSLSTVLIKLNIPNRGTSTYQRFEARQKIPEKFFDVMRIINFSYTKETELNISAGVMRSVIPRNKYLILSFLLISSISRRVVVLHF